MNRMKATRFYGPQDLRIEHVEIPSVGPGEILVRVKAALTCGTDLKAYRQGHPVMLGESYPVPFGHECAGIVEKVGQDVERLGPGMRVVCANSAPCGECYFCSKNRANLCENLEFLNGAFAEYIKVPASIVRTNTYKIPETMSFRHAAIAEPFACAVHAFHRLEIHPNDRVVILGCGMMGLLFSAVALHHGAQIIAVGRNDEKLETAKKLGVQNIVNVAHDSNPVERVQSMTNGYGADFVIEAVGKPEAWEQAVQMTRKGGTVCLFGGCKKGSTFSLDTFKVHYEEVRIEGIFHHTPFYFKKALEYLHDEIFDPDLLISREIPLHDVVQFFQTQAFSSPFKTVVTP